ncbi:methyltransferase [Agromyces sp. SYSU K20354]|uniref:class I SAM-dependent methyltransferase n=1 Tax=Agromyces cavernae TaxID=2898659 RepID=UPI001E2C5124|nr:methyltransferase [Agromyces cavernae]MCD2441054.1 methyltransferase [Agromyces cavernae]
MPFDFGVLRRRPDIEGPGLEASDAADRLVLDEAAALIAASGPGDVAVIDDAYGAIALGAADAGVRGIRVHQDLVTGERALAENAARTGLVDAVRSMPFTAELVADVRLVLVRLPRSLDRLDEVAGLVAAHAHPEVVLVAGGRIKHMSLAMNDVLRRHFGALDVSHARQKSRVLIAREPVGRGAQRIETTAATSRDTASGLETRPPSSAAPRPAGEASAPRPAGEASAAPRPATWPRRERHDDLGLTVVAHGGVFAGTGVDIGTRFLLAHLADAVPDAATAVDLACGTGVVATWLARERAGLRVTATDRSASAAASARLTADANGVADRVHVTQADGLELLADASERLVVLNPPFHSDAALHTGIAAHLFADAARVLAPGGELLCVWNSHLRYRPMLERVVGPTRQIARNAKFTVTASARRT